MGSTVALAVIIALAIGGLPRMADSSCAVGSRTQPAAELPPAPAIAMAAYREVNNWVRGWRVPEAAPENLSALSGGVHVQLRLQGVLVGKSEAFPAEGQSAAAALMLAVRDAMSQAETRVALPNDALRDAALVEYAKQIQISLELAGPLMAFEPQTWEEAEILLAPGLDGVAVRIRPEGGAPGQLSAAFPSFMMATAALPHRTLGGLCAKVIGEGGAAAALEQPRRIRERHSVRMYRFRTIHLAQCKPGAEPVFLHRGARLVQQSEITAAELQRMAAAMAEHLARRADRPDVGLGWGYSYDPLDPARHIEGKASIESTTLALLALKRYDDLGTGRIPELTGSRVHAAWSATAEAVCKRFDRYHGEDETALFLIAAASQPESALKMPFDPADCMSIPLRDPVKSLILREWPNGDMFGGVPQTTRGACALAYAMIPQSKPLLEKGVSRSLSDVEQQVRSWIATIPSGQLVAHMPWLGWAEMELARHKANANGKPADIPSAIALREMRRQVWEHQISAADAADTPDFAGGIVFTKSRSPLPTWQSVRPLAFIATMLRDDRLTDPGERNAELVRLLASIRFIRQLQADESIGWMSPSPELAIGGVRSATWDHSMPPDATSMALLLVTEAIRSLDALSKPAAPAAQPANAAGPQADPKP